MSLRSELRVKLSVAILHKNDVWSLPPVVCSKAHVLFTLFVFVYGGVQHILCCSCFFFVLLLFVSCILCCQFLWIVHLLLPLQYPLTFIYMYRIQCLSPQKYGVRNRPRRGVLDTILCNHFVECSVRHK